MSVLPRRIELTLGGRRLAAIHGGVNEISRFVFPGTAPEAKAGELSTLQSQLELAQQGWKAKMEELERSRKSLADLQREVEGEVRKVQSGTSELMPQYGITERGAAPTGGLPKLGNAKPRGSVERFQKLRRDAKRKAIGAG